jgi:guanylate kinase
LSNLSTKKLIIITAPSGAGKSTIVNYLLKAIPALHFSVSVCTRKPRIGEIDGQHYYFITVENFEQKIKDQQFAEYEMVYEGKYYGTLMSELENAWEHNKTPLCDIDVQGALRLKKNNQYQAISIFIKPPSLQELEKRLMLRGTETPETLKERIQKAAHELTFENQFDHVIINDVLDVACEEIRNVVRKFIDSQILF